MRYELMNDYQDPDTMTVQPGLRDMVINWTGLDADSPDVMCNRDS